MKLNIPNCRVWRASEDLLEVLPREKEAPRFEAFSEDIEPYTHNDLDYVLCRRCAWHTDWPELFSFVVVRGSMNLEVGPLGSQPQSQQWEKCPIIGSCILERGDVIQLWPLAYHRVTGRGRLALLSITVDSSTKQRRYFPRQSTCEALFKRMIRDGSLR